MIRLSHDPVEVGAMLERIGSPDGVTRADLAGADNWHAWIWGGGLFVVVDRDDGMGDVHVYVYPSARGKHAIQAAGEVRVAEGRPLIGRTPLNNLPARRFASLCGGVVVGVEDDEEVRVWVN